MHLFFSNKTRRTVEKIKITTQDLYEQQQYAND